MFGVVTQSKNAIPHKKLKIGELAEQAGVPVGTIRYYETLGLLEPDHRSESGYRYYGPGAVRQLQFIKKAQCLDFTLQEIQQVLGARREGGPACPKVRELLDQKVAELDTQIARFQTLKVELETYQKRWQDRPLDNPDTQELCSLVEEVVDRHPMGHKGFGDFS